MSGKTVVYFKPLSALLKWPQELLSHRCDESLEAAFSWWTSAHSVSVLRALSASCNSLVSSIFKVLILRVFFTHPLTDSGRSYFKALLFSDPLITALHFFFSVSIFCSFTNFSRFSISWPMTWGRISSFSALLSSNHAPLLSPFLYYEWLNPTPVRSSLATAEETTVVPTSSLEPQVQVLVLCLYFGKPNLPNQPRLSLSVSERVHVSLDPNPSGSQASPSKVLLMCLLLLLSFHPHYLEWIPWKLWSWDHSRRNSAISSWAEGMGTVNGAIGLLTPKLEPVRAADVVAGVPRGNLVVSAISVLFWNIPEGRFISEKSDSKVLKEQTWKLKVQMLSSKTEPLVGA